MGQSRLLRYSTRRGRGQLGPVNLGSLVPGLASQADHITTSEGQVWTKVILDRELSTILVDKPVDYLDF